MKYNKLIRDTIPEILDKKGVSYKIHIASEEEYWLQLKEKLVEEVEKFSKSEAIEELADILEVIEAIMTYKNFDQSEIQTEKIKKATERGKFAKRIILEES